MRLGLHIPATTWEACLRMWDGERGAEQPFAGRHVRIERPLNLPQSISRPHPPITPLEIMGREVIPVAAEMTL